MLDTNDIVMVVLLVLQFAIYTLCAIAIHRLPIQGDFKRVLRLIWLGAVAAGLIYVLTPAMPSRDIFVYAGYGRIIVDHHANPYFTTLAAFPQDPLSSFDDWKYSTAAYGPAWLVICSIETFFLGNAPVAYGLAELNGLVGFIERERRLAPAEQQVAVGTHDARDLAQHGAPNVDVEIEEDGTFITNSCNWNTAFCLESSCAIGKLSWRAQ